MSLSQFQHVPIPFDQLQLFLFPEQNQMFLIQTLLLSTKVTLIVNKHKYLSKLIITKHNIWFVDQKKKKNIFALPTTSLITIIKSQQFPQLIFVTTPPFDNIHIILTNQQRCNSILSGLSYLFSRIMKKLQPLKVYFINNNSLKQFQKTGAQKIKDNKFMQEIQHKYPSRFIVYKQKGNSDLFGQLNLQNKRICLMKTVYTSHNHIVHVAKIVPSYSTSTGQINLHHTNQTHTHSQVQDYYYIHTIQKTPQILSALHKFQPYQYEDIVEELVYARQLDYKIQLFFKYHSQLPKEGSPYYTYQLTPQRLFINLMEFYDLLLQQQTSTVLTLDLLCYQKIQSPVQSLKTKSFSNKRSFCLTQEHNTSFSQIVIKLREFRYDFLLTDNNQMNKLIYHCYYQNDNLVYDPSLWKTKFYHLGLLLYEFLYGRPYFSEELSPQVILQMKKRNKLIFPKYIDTDSAPLMSWELQNFIQKSIKLKFKSLQDVYQHPWMKENVMILAYQQPVLISTKNQDKKTDATKSF